MMPPPPAQALLDWLLASAPGIVDLRQLVAALVDRLDGAGVPVDRMSAGFAALHPEIRSIGYIWTRGDSFVRERFAHHGIERTDDYIGSPFQQIINGEPIVRYRLDATLGADGHAILRELREEGFTDYIAHRLDFSDGNVGVISFVTRKAGGFGAEAVAILAAMRPLLALVVNIQVERFVARGVLDTYLGREVGRRILAGEVRRGEGVTIRSALLFCDMRGFAALSDRLPLEALIRLLNDYFEAIIEPVAAQGGEVLKLIGDGMLAIFRIDETAETKRVCDAAMTAAELASANIAHLNRRRVRGSEDAIRFGIALHVGDVMYGNVGAASRLDFTVIGPAVNRVARLEGLAGSLGRDLVTSAEFAAAATRPLVAIGRHALKGIADPLEVYGAG
ncbi:MAG: adenylate/guanylate cyclase domain-containing protein [Alphaproteobacteria bacterium]|nr:adenylate/guanylate cyclase domain-containing protein [Alphaproteobacteria bacterium]